MFSQRKLKEKKSAKVNEGKIFQGLGEHDVLRFQILHHTTTAPQICDLSLPVASKSVLVHEVVAVHKSKCLTKWQER